MNDLQAPIFDVQRFSIHDGPGIRTLVFFKGCNLRCDWCQNPESQALRVQLAFHANRCDQAGACADACPHGAIRLEGFRIDYSRCTTCLRCVDACAAGALQPVGRPSTPEALLALILKDRSYYASSGGGVTFSGGEPTLYPHFMARMLALCRAASVHTVLETCGSFAWPRWQGLLRQFDLLYFDLKIIDPQRHRGATGVDNRRILRNAEWLAQQGYPVEFRLPLVPGYTDDLANRHAIVALLRRLGQPRLHLLGYHAMGEAKIDILQGPQKKLGLPAYTPDQLDAMRCWFTQQGVQVLTP